MTEEEVIKDKGLQIIIQIEHLVGGLWVLGDISSEQQKEILKILFLPRQHACGREKYLNRKD